MKPRLTLLALLLLCGCEKPAVADPSRVQESMEPRGWAELRAASDDWFARREAMEAAYLKQIETDAPFGLVYLSGLGFSYPVGVVCEAPPGRRYDGHLAGRGSVSISDVAGETNMDLVARREAEGAMRNRAVIDDPAFPYVDVCRPARDGERRPRPGDDFPRELIGDTPARTVSGPARSLHDAARRGTPAEIRAWAARTAVIDTPDAFATPPLTWAVLRNRPDAVRTLVSLGANPDMKMQNYGESARWTAARAGHADIFALLPPPIIDFGPGLNQQLLAAAVKGGSPDIVRTLLAEPDQHRAWTTLFKLNSEQGSREIRALLIEDARKTSAGSQIVDGLEQGPRGPRLR